MSHQQEPAAKRRKMDGEYAVTPTTSDPQVGQKEDKPMLALAWIGDQLWATTQTRKVEYQTTLQAVVKWAAEHPYEDWKKIFETPKAASVKIRENYLALMPVEEAYKWSTGMEFEAATRKAITAFVNDMRLRICNFFKAQRPKQIMAAIFVKLCEARNVEDLEKILGADILKLYRSLPKSSKNVWDQVIVLPREYHAYFPGAVIEQEAVSDSLTNDLCFPDEARSGRTKVILPLETVGRLLPGGEKELKEKRRQLQYLQARVLEIREKLIPLQKELESRAKEIQAMEQELDDITKEALVQAWRAEFEDSAEGLKSFKVAIAANISLRNGTISPEDFLQILMMTSNRNENADIGNLTLADIENMDNPFERSNEASTNGTLHIAGEIQMVNIPFL